MGRKSTRIRCHRRDRRKAKASGWRRGPRRKMNGSTGHGETGSNTTYSSKPGADKRIQIEKVEPLCSPIADDELSRLLDDFGLIR